MGLHSEAVCPNCRLLFCRGASLPDGAFKQVMFLFTLQQLSLHKHQLWLGLFKCCPYVLILQLRGFSILSLWAIAGNSSWKMCAKTSVRVDVLPAVRQLGCTSFFSREIKSPFRSQLLIAVCFSLSTLFLLCLVLGNLLARRS